MLSSKVQTFGCHPISKDSWHGQSGTHTRQRKFWNLIRSLHFKCFQGELAKRLVAKFSDCCSTCLAGPYIMLLDMLNQSWMQFYWPEVRHFEAEQVVAVSKRSGLIQCSFLCSQESIWVLQCTPAWLIRACWSYVIEIQKILSEQIAMQVNIPFYVSRDTGSKVPYKHSNCHSKQGHPPIRMTFSAPDRELLIKKFM